MAAVPAGANTSHMGGDAPQFLHNAHFISVTYMRNGTCNSPRRGPMNKHFTFAAAILALSSGCVDSDLPVGSSDHAIVGGTLNRDDPAVVAILATYSGGGQSLCTGTLVSKDVVLTAAHCLNGQAPESRIVFFGSDLQQGTSDPDFLAAIDAVDSTYDVRFSIDDLTAGHDIGMIRLAQDAPAAVTPDPLNRTAPTVGQAIRLTGFGRIEPVPQDGADNGGGAGIKREVVSTIRSFTDAFQASANPPDLVAYGSTVSNTCQGDSGGPNFITVSGTEYIAGITSFGDRDCNLAGAGTRVDRYIDYITTYVANGGAACIDDGICEQACTDPDPDCAADQCGADGECVEICGAQDPDCSSAGGAANDDNSSSSKVLGGGCSAGGAGQSGPLWLVAFVTVLALGRRRRQRC